MSKILEEKLKWYAENYRGGNALIFDNQFDKLEKNLERINPESNYFSAKNNLMLPSLPKDQLKEFLNGLLNKTRLIIEPKIKGCAIGLQYQNGILTKAISRKGNDFTAKLIALPDVPKRIKVKGIFQVRGELFAPSESKRATYSQNQAIYYLGASKSKSDHLSFCCFQILNGRLNQYDSLVYLKKLGFTTPENYFCNYTSGVEIFRKNWLDKKLFSDYPTDGIVVKINSRKLQLIREKSVGIYPFWQMAIMH